MIVDIPLNKYEWVKTKGEQADFCTSEVQKYREVQRSTENYKEVERSKRYLPRFFPKTEQKCSVIEKYQKFCSQKQNKSVLLLGNIKNSIPKNRTKMFCFLGTEFFIFVMWYEEVQRSIGKYREVQRSTRSPLVPPW
jgi:hypothetical protein